MASYLRKGFREVLVVRFWRSGVFFGEKEGIWEPSAEGGKAPASRGQKGTYGRSSSKPTVGFFGDLPWIVFTPFRRPVNTGALERPP